MTKPSNDSSSTQVSNELGEIEYVRQLNTTDHNIRTEYNTSTKRHPMSIFGIWGKVIKLVKVKSWSLTLKHLLEKYFY